MPFDPEAYRLKCAEMPDDVLLARRSHYVRRLASSATGAALHTAAGGFTFGLTWLLVPYDAARIHNARRKRRILEEHALDRGLAVETKRGDVLVPMAAGLALGAVAFEGAAACAELLVDGGEGSSEATLVKGAAHLGLDAAIAAAEQSHAQKEKTTAERVPEWSAERASSLPEEIKKK
ncbi:uncharacterized protein ColSpa_08657 [Colletotrichum spaethianum]|uniref:Uncharacterized protein n=1 Tax=Colletotrichum spaethianum TaxID=700344 RepID=A0AA37PA85_9PEZI|nr:uncharacterized protein ColSpa_08657 [Colletotrichum spaethianum]GKT48476.1 hypothetical protein ColSpa_08657 [Colletotrichum spaethianum]